MKVNLAPQYYNCYAIITDMQPEHNQPIIGPENTQETTRHGGERVPILPSPEKGLELGPDKKVEQISEASAVVSDMSHVHAPAIDDAAITTVDSNMAADDSPAIAGDDDVIEREWVDRAKKIIQDTKGDPHQRTSKVNQLQKSYLRKRYGKELGVVE